MKFLARLVYVLLQAAAAGATAVVKDQRPQTSSDVTGSHHSSVASGDGGDQQSPPPPSSKSPFIDYKWSNVTLEFFVIFISVSVGVGLVALVVILCAYCRENKLLEASDDSSSEGVYSRTTSLSSNSCDSGSFFCEGQANATHRRQHARPPSTVSDETISMSREEVNDDTDWMESVVQGDTRFNEWHGFPPLLAHTSPSVSDNGAATVQSLSSRLSLACSRRGSYRKVR
ncbi:hypothetical protein JKF63_02835 [Porcisia hertigi]|uniref:Uncharacterized protein n=1 Tax=Porcisia hertigi TaxID=2761500 RepID=A0A836HVZ8_9TRYP|nr:hypothetical protein JKF63_02835 [Porcisia hertigi]